MSIIYFSNNADSGNGSLRIAIESAQPGDIIRPDETVFERGSTIEIALASLLTIGKTLTLDGGPYRVRLNAGGAFRCATASGGDGVKFAAFDFVNGAPSTGDGGCVSASVPLTLERCGVYGGVGGYGGGVFARSTLTLNDCVVTGCHAKMAGGGVMSLNGLTLRGTTIIGNVSANANSDAVRHEGGDLSATNSIVGPVRATGGGALSYPGSVVDVASSQIGFVVAPPDDFSVDNWTSNAWQDWDLRLLDDASPNPSPYRDAGDVDASSKYDYQGNFRGRESEGIATCSPGAFETIQANLFWVGRDATGAEVASPSWVNANGWAASRFATVSGDVAPQNGDVVFIDGSIAFDGNNLRLGKLIVGGGATISVDNSSGATLTSIANQFDFGVGSTLRNVGASTQRFQVGRATLVSRFGDWVNIQPQFLLGDAAELEIAPTAKFTTVASSVKLYANGFYTNYNLQVQNVATVEGDSNGCENVYINFQKLTARITANGMPRVSSNTLKWTIPTGATSDYTALTDGSTPIVFAPIRSATVAGNGSRDDFLIDVSNAKTYGTFALSLTGQTVYGDAPMSAVALDGSARVDERGLTSQSLTLNVGATLNVDSGFACVKTLTVSDGATVAFSGDDAVLTATENATVGAASFTGAGYFATPPGTTLDSAVFVETVRKCDYGANVVSIAASTSGKTVTLNWNAETPDVSVLVEQKIVGGWKTVANGTVDKTTTVAVDTSGDIMFRIFDGDKFLLTSVYVDRFHAWLVYDNLFTSAVVVKSYKIVTEVVLMSVYFNANESPIFLARIVDSATSVPVAPSDVESIALTVYKQELYRGSKRKTELSGWVNVVVPTSTIKEELVVDDPRWKKDSVGYNFLYEPDLREKKLFAQAGEYVAIITVAFKEGNPAPLVFNVSVK